MNNIRFQRLSSMLEMTVMAHAKVPANNDFTIDNWAKFQDMLKSNYLIVNSGTFEHVPAERPNVLYRAPLQRETSQRD